MSKRWVRERRRDPYYLAAQRGGLRSRAVFKLLQLQERFNLIAPGARVLDLGAAPGGWSLAARELAGSQGAVVAVDVRRFEPLEGITFLRGRVGSPELVAKLQGKTFDVILSDMSPAISGNYSTDHARSVELVRSALALAEAHLVLGGSFVAKLFDGDMTGELRKEFRKRFREVLLTKPMASRSASSEVFLVCLGAM